MSLVRTACVLLALPLAACVFVVDGDGDWHGPFGWHGVRGSGVRAEEHRHLEAFRAVDLDTCASVTVKVGEEPSVELSGDDNLLPLVRTRVSNGVLSLDTERSCSFREDLEIVIRTPTLERFTIEGSGDVRIDDLASEDLVLEIEGSGTLTARGRTQKLEGSIEGSGELDLDELGAEHASLSIEGSGTIVANVAHELRYSIEGSGDIRYIGTPRLTGDIDGSGSIGRKR